MHRLADLALTRPRRVLLAAAAVLLLSATAVPGIFDALYPAGFRDPDTPSERAADALRDAAGFESDPGIIVLVRVPEGAPDPGPAVRERRVAAVAAVLREERALGLVVTGAQDASLRSSDGRTTLVGGFFRSREERDKVAAVEHVRERLAAERFAPLEVRVGGPGTAFITVNAQVERDLQRGELLAFPLLFLLLVVIFRGLVAAALPLVVGALSVLATIAGLRLLNELIDVSVFSVNLVSALGLGLAVDYSLFLVSRFREELARTGATDRALRTTMATAGRTVVVSALTVAAALLALVLFPQRFLYSMGIGGAGVALLAAVASLTVVPALLALLGPRVNALPFGRSGTAVEERRTARWRRIAAVPRGRPGVVTVVALAGMVLLSAPSLRLERTGIDERVLPPTSDVRVVSDAIAAAPGFPEHADSPATLAITASPAQDGEVRALARAAAALPGTAAVLPPRRVGPDLVALRVVQRDDPFSDAAVAHARALGALPTGLPVLVAGQAAGLHDFRASVDDHLPAALLVAAGATVVLLFLLTGSVVLPIGAVLVNLLTLTAAYGLLVVVFQDGLLAGPLDFATPPGIETGAFMLVFAMVFGLSTDYAVFLLARVTELRRAGHDDRTAVALATERTGSLITAAAALFCVAVGALATSGLVFLKETGVGTAAAVAIDATIVRVLLVPAVMHLLGARAWWRPRGLARVHARLGISEA